MMAVKEKKTGIDLTARKKEGKKKKKIKERGKGKSEGCT